MEALCFWRSLSASAAHLILAASMNTEGASATLFASYFAFAMWAAVATLLALLPRVAVLAFGRAAASACKFWLAVLT